MKVEESLNVTFDESTPPTKLSPLVDDYVGEEEAIKIKVNVDNNNVENESIEVDEYDILPRSWFFDLESPKDMVFMLGEKGLVLDD
ncbi:hypothetical protein Tco_1405408 [Tanacetum coccineum]